MRKTPPSREAARERRAWIDESTAWKHGREVARGYRIKWGYVAIAYLVEFLVIGASLAGAWLFAEVYADHDAQSFWFMLLAPLVYAAIELCRVPLGILSRTQRSWFLKGLACLGILFAAGVTTKSVSQLGEMMFRPRLTEVTMAHSVLKEAESVRASLDTRIAAADARVEAETAQLQAIEKRSSEAAAQLSGLPAQRCERVYGTNRNGVRYSNLKCVADPRTAAMAGSLQTAGGERTAVAKSLDAARAERATLDRQAVDKRVTDAEAKYRDAVRRSQLHSFTAMVFGVDPTDVTDTQVHLFLRIFVFVPALCAAFASTILALCSVSVRRTFMDEDDLGAAVDPEAAPYLLAPFAEGIVSEVNAALQKSVREGVASGAAIPLEPRRPIAATSQGLGPSAPPPAPAAIGTAGALQPS